MPAPAVDSVAHRLLEARLLQRLVGVDEPEAVRVDRFVLERELGAGGMGTIYAAWDEQLRRRVALKFLHRVGTDEASEQRLFREAQALAQLSHPNVVSVHQVGRHEGRVWLAMEHIAGQTLRAWAQPAPRTRAEILRIWLAAGRGLAAIHAAGLVHRDIKPDNIMIGDDGRVRIVDFGLVRLAEAAHPSASETGLSTVAEWSEGLTAHDGFVGTPAYAAPEQVDGGVIDARSDQYAFCVSLWEALYGKRPLRERRPDGLPVLREGERLPRRIHRALARGLMLEPSQRWTGMEALLAALEPPRRRWLVPGVVGSGAAAIGLVAGMMMLGEPAAVVVEDPCVRAGNRLGEVWSADRLQPLSATLSEAAVTRARELTNDWASDWQHVAREACEDVHVRQLRSPESLDRRGVCLDRRLADLSALGVAVEAGQITEDGELVAWLGRLEDPTDCMLDAVLASEITAPPPEHAEGIAQVRRILTGVQLETGGSLDDRISEGERALVRAQSIRWTPLVAEAALALGWLHTIAGDGPRARLRLGEALDIAERVRDIELHARVWSALNGVERLVELDVERARWAERRHAGVFEGFEPSGRQRARMLVDRGMTHELAGEVQQAERLLREAVSLLDDEGLAAAWEQAKVLRNLGNLLAYTGRAREGRALFDRARDLELGSSSDAQVGGSARDSVANLLDEGIATIADGDPQRAVETLQLALDRATLEHGPRSEMVARAHVALAAAYDYLGQPNEVRAHAERADSISMVAVGATHPLRVDVLSALGVSAYSDKRFADAMLAFERALRLVRHIKPADSTAVALAERNLADALHEDGQDERADALLTHALPILERELGAEDPQIGEARELQEAIRTNTRGATKP
jgi:tetratricopeptide (TPR) repeat protein/predicted Ser/Thr protein kinase